MSKEKKRKSSSDGQGDHLNNLFEPFICPILKRLPGEPVLGPDGCVCDRDALERARRDFPPDPEEGFVRYPQGHKISRHNRTLHPLPQVKEMIQKAFDDNILKGRARREWLKDMKRIALIKEAENGTGEEMYWIGNYYYSGNDEFDFVHDKCKAAKWFQRSHEKDCAMGTAGLGSCFLRGDGVPKNAGIALSLLALALHKGSDFATFELGSACADENFYCRSTSSAIFYLKLIADKKCEIEHMDVACYDAAKRLLIRLNNRRPIELIDLIPPARP